MTAQNQSQTIIKQLTLFLAARGLSRLSVKLYILDLKKYLHWLLEVSGDLTLSSLVNPSYPHLYLNHLRSSGASLATINRSVASLKQLGAFLAATNKVIDPTLDLSRGKLRHQTTQDPFDNYIKLFTNYLTEQKLSPLSIKSYKSDISRFLAWISKDTPSTRIDVLLKEKNFKKYLNHLQESDNVASSTLYRKEQSLARFYNWFTKTYEQTIPTDNKKSIRNLSQMGKNPVSLEENRSIPVSSPSLSTKSLPSRFAKLLPLKNIPLPSSFASILTLLFLILFSASLGIFTYRQLARDRVVLTQAYPSTPVTPNRQLSFQGRLEDSGGSPITSATNLVFKLFDTAATGTGTELYTTGTCSITPDEDGVFSIQIGSDCGSAISSDVFTENAEVWLEVTVAGEVLDPRQQIATVAYALNAETLQGYPIDATGSATRSTVVTMNQWGEILIGEQSPKVKSVAGSFNLIGQALLLKTDTGTNGDITLQPDGTGSVNIYSNTQSDDSVYIQNAQLTTGALIHAYYGGSSTDVDLLRLGSGDPETTKFLVESNGNIFLEGNIYDITDSAVTIGESLFVTGYATASASLAVGYNSVLGGIGNGVFSGKVGIGTTNPGYALDVVGEAKIGTLNAAGSDPGTVLVHEGNILRTLSTADWDKNASDDVTTFLGLTDTPSSYSGNANQLVRVNAGTDALEFVDPATVGTNYWQFNDNTLTPKNETFALTIGNVASASAFFHVPGTNNKNAWFNLGTGNLGIGTTDPGYKLDVTGNARITTMAAGGTDTVVTHNTGVLETRTIDSRVWGSTLMDGSSLTENYLTKVSDANTIINSIVFDDGSNVGIGSSTPTAKLDVEGSASSSGSLTFRGTDPKINILNGENFGIRTSVGGDTGLVEKLTLTNGGYLGIGTTAPGYTLDVSGQTRIGTLNSGSTDTVVTHASGVLQTKTIDSRVWGSTLLDGSSLQANYLTRISDTNTLINSLIYDNGSQIGIGTTAPEEQLTLTGNIQLGLTDAERYIYFDNGTANNAGIRYEPATDKLQFSHDGTTWEDFGSGSGDSLWQLTTKNLTPVNETYALTVGSVATASAFFHVPGTNNQNAFFNLGTGNLGIGTTDPLVKLHVEGTDNKFRLTYPSVANLDINVTSSGYGLFSVSGGNDMVIDGTGNIGLGTATPITKLDISGSASTSGTLTFRGTTDPKIDILNGEYFGIRTSPGGNVGLSEKFTVSNSGRVGIGNANPDYTLDVVGDAKIGTLASGATDTVVTHTSGVLNTRTIDSRVWGSTLMDGSSLTENYLTKVSDANTLINSLLFDNGSGVGIGTTDPDIYKLSVNGDTNVIGNLVVSGTTTFGGLAYTWPATQNSGYILRTDGSGNLSWIDPNVAASGVIFWTQNEGALYPKNSTVDLLIGGDATSSAKFAFTNINSGSPTATISGNLALTVPTGSDPATTFDILNGGTLNLRTSVGGNTGLNSRLYLTNSGDIGIGTTDPGVKLNVVGSIAMTGVNPFLGLSSTNPSSGWAIREYGGDYIVSDDGSYYFTIDDSTHNTTINGGSNISGSKLGVNGNVAIGSNYYLSAALTDGLIVEGSVGIGTTDPSAKLDVNGNLNVSGYATASASLAVGYNTVPGGHGNGIFSNRVGIGTTEPGFTLDVTGNARITNMASGGTNTVVTHNSGALQTRTIDSRVWGSTLMDGSSLTQNYLTKVLDSDTLVNSLLFDNGSGVGIGTTDPDTYALNVNGTINSTGYYINGSAMGTVTAGSLAGQTLYWNGSTWTPNSNLFYSSAWTRVGIGTTDPGYKLDVNGDARISTLNAGATDTVVTHTSGVLNTRTIDSRVWGSSLVDGSLTQGYLPKATDTNTLTDSLAFDNGSGVGIGTTDPQALLHVLSTNTGSVPTDQNLPAAGNVLVSSPNDSSSYTGLSMQTKTTNSAAALIGLAATSADNGDIFFRLKNSSTTSTEVMRISSSGEVGIGTTDPTDLLHIYSSSAGSTIGTTIQNTDNTNDASHSRLFLSSGGSLGGDPFIRLDIDSTQSWSMGVDNSDSDSFKISAASTLGTNDWLVVGTTGNVGINGNLYDLTDSAVTIGESLYISGYATASASLSVGYLSVPGGIGNAVFSGMVGIGTSNPTANLNVAGTAAFDGAGDVEIAYNLNFSNDTASYIRSQAPLYIEAGDPNSAEDLVLRSRGSGDVVVGSNTAYFRNNGDIDIMDGSTYKFRFYNADKKFLIGASSGYTNYLQVTDETLGNLKILGAMGSSDYFRIEGTGTSNAGVLKISTGDDGTEPIYFSQFAGATEYKRMEINSSGNIGIEGNLYDITDSSVTIGESLYVSGNADATGGVKGAYLGVQNTDSTSGYGLSLYNGYSAGAPTYGVMFAGTGTFGTYGGVTSDWATYFTMSNTTTRGWIFRRGSTNVASINGNGVLALEGYIYDPNSVLELNDSVDITGQLTLSYDATDVINFTPNSTNDNRGIAFNARTALSADYNDGWLRLNNASEFSNGVYTPGYLRVDGRLYIGSSGYMYNDSGSRIAIPNDFYVQATSGNTYLYSTNTYLGNTSGDNIYARGNTISGNGWSITGAGAATFATINTGPGTTEVYLMNQHVRSSDSPSWVSSTVSRSEISGAWGGTWHSQTAGYSGWWMTGDRIASVWASREYTFLSSRYGTDYNTVLRVYAAGGHADIAERIQSSEPTEKGDLVSIDTFQEQSRVKITDQAYDPNLIGVVSTRPGLAVYGGGDGVGVGSGIHKPMQPNVALAGRVPVKVMILPGETINLGDAITSSPIKAFGMVAKKSAKVIGQTLENLTPSDTTCPTVDSLQSIAWPQGEEDMGEGENESKPCFRVPTSSLPSITQSQIDTPYVYVGKVMVYAGPSWYNPDIYLTATGDLIISQEASGSYQVANSSNGSIINKITAFAELVVAKLRAGAITAKEISTDSLTVAGVSLEQYVKNIIYNTATSSAQLISPQASLDTLTINDNLSANQAEISYLHITGSEPNDGEPSLVVDGSLEASTISARLAQLENINAGSITVDSLNANSIKADTIEGLDAKLAALSADTIVNQYYYATSSATSLSDSQLDEVTETIKSRIAKIINPGPTASDIPIETTPTGTEPVSFPESTPSADITDDLNLLPYMSVDMLTVNDYFAVIGQATITTLNITNTLYTESISSKSDTLSLMPLGGFVKLANNTLIVDGTTGKVSVNGNLTVSGSLIADSANLNSLTLGQPATSSASTLGQLMTIYNEQGQEVASIDASGSANLNEVATRLITIASASDASQSASASALASLIGTKTETNATAGEATLVSPNTELIINNSAVDENSLIYITPTSSTFNQVLYIKSKEPGKFTVAVPRAAAANITFNWWIIKLQQPNLQANVSN